MPVMGVRARSYAIRPAEPRRNANGVAAILPTRVGVSSGSRPRPDSSTALTASGREAARWRALCALRGSRRRRALPSALGVPAAGHSANPGTRGSRRPSPAAPVPPVRGAPAAPWVPAVPALNSVILDRPRPLYLTYTRSTVIVPTVQPVTERRQALWTTHSLWTTRPPGWRPARRAP